MSTETVEKLEGMRARHAMNNKQKCHLLTMLFLLIAWLPAFSGCSSLEGTGGNQRVTTRLLKSIEQEHEKPANPPVHPGQPYIRDPGENP
jgi:hypothetical protein